MFDPIIKPPVTEAQIKAAVDALITPERADEEASALALLLTGTSGGEDAVQRDNMDIALRYAFSKTTAYERVVEPAYKAFLGYPTSMYPTVSRTIELAGEAG